MSSVGGIGTLMEGSGLDKAKQNVYGKNTQKQIAKGKEVVQGVRAHILSNTTLMIQLQQRVVNPSNENNGSSVENQSATFCIEQYELDKILELHNKVTTKEVQIIDTDSLELKKFVQLTEEKKQEVIDTPQTSKLWIQYIDYVKTMQNFIRVKGTGDWSLHLVSVYDIINNFNFCKVITLTYIYSSCWSFMMQIHCGIKSLQFGKMIAFELTYSQAWQQNTLL